MVSPDGQRTETAAPLTSSDSQIASTRESAVQGMAAGQVTIEARVPGISESGQAKYQVVDIDFKRLVFTPPSSALAVRERKTFKLSAVTKSERKSLAIIPICRSLLKVAGRT